MTSRLARPLAAAFLATLVVLAGSISPAAAVPPPSDQNYGEARILWLMNEERRIHGLPPVARNAAADDIAQYSANVNAWYNRLAHNPNLAKDVSEKVTPAWHYVGENVGCGADADNLHGMWMRSPGHAQNLLNRGAETVGIGVVYARGCLWATVVFVDT
jgi:uncharacterized protein YkwD